MIGSVFTILITRNHDSRPPNVAVLQFVQIRAVLCVCGGGGGGQRKINRAPHAD